MEFRDSKYIHLNWNDIRYREERLNDPFRAYEDIFGYLLLTSNNQKVWEEDVQKFIILIGEDLKSCINNEKVNLYKINELTEILNYYLFNGINYIYSIRNHYIRSKNIKKET